MKKVLLRVALGAPVLVLVLLGALVAYVEATASARLQFPDTPLPSVTASSDPDVIERGRLLVHGPSHCAACHGTYDVDHPSALRADVPLSGGAEIRPPFGIFRPSNITGDPDTGIGAWSDAEIARVIRTGVRRNGELSLFMKFSVGDTSDDDLTAIVSYLRSVAPVRAEVPPSEPNFMARALVTFTSMPPDDLEGLPHVAAGSAPSIERGSYLANGPTLCVGCHSPPSPDDMFSPDPARLGAGGEPMEGHGRDDQAEFAPPNLTADEETGVTGRISEDGFLARFRLVGRTRSGSPMPWENFERLSDDDLRSIYRYLRSLPPIHRNTGPPVRAPGSFTVEEEP
jgi:mono/diheme cytochrome c family protein